MKAYNARTMREVRINRTKKDRGFLWTTHRGETLGVKEMATEHLFNTLRMLWNNTAAPCFRIGKFKRWDLSHLTKADRCRAFEAIANELNSRDNKDADIKEELSDLERNAAVINFLMELGDEAEISFPTLS